jgi:hypothetical protein
MANLVKAKAGISFFSVSVVLLVQLLEYNYFVPLTIKRWSQLSWDDFQGFPRPIGNYDAAISSEVYLEYDSVNKKYYAYAGQNNARSWVRQSTYGNEYALNHEQYHFNITELHARSLNHYINEFPEDNLYSYELRLGSLNIDLNNMQDQYDSETDHSIILDKQRRWEFRIDSMLMLEDGWFTDLYSGAKAYFPFTPDSSKGFSGTLNVFENNVPYRNYFLNRYAMLLTLSSYLIPKFKSTAFADSINRIYDVKSEKIKSISVDSLGGCFEWFVISEDTSNHTIFSRWVYEQPYLYRTYAHYPNDLGDSTGYVQNAKSFINSFSVMNTDEYWINKSTASANEVTVSEFGREDPPKGKNLKACYRVGQSRQLGFYRRAFLTKDGEMLLPYDNLTYSDSLHYENMLLVNKNVLTQKFNGETIYSIPGGWLGAGTYQIRFGYTLKEDSVNKCRRFYYETVEIALGESKFNID